MRRRAPADFDSRQGLQVDGVRLESRIGGKNLGVTPRTCIVIEALQLKIGKFK